MIIILSPYSNNPKYNFEKNFEYLEKLMKEGKPTFSPIVYGHFLAETMDLKGDYKTWEFLNKLFKIAKEFHILCLKDWHSSEGLNMEFSKIAKMKKPIYWIDENFEQIYDNEFPNLFDFINKNLRG